MSEESVTEAPIENSVTPEVKPELTEAEKHQKEFNVQYKKAMSAERERDTARQEKEALQARIDELTAPKAPAGVPDMPDQFDDDYTVKMQARDAALSQQAEYQAGQRIQQQQQQQAAQATLLKQQQEAQERTQTHWGNAQKSGATQEDYLATCNELNGFLTNQDLANKLMTDDYAMTQYLAKNPQEVHTLQTLDPMSAGVRYAELKAKVKPAAKITNAPDPVETLNGGVVPETKSPHFKGATFE